MAKDTRAVVFSLLEKKGPVPGNTEQEKMNYRYLDAGHVGSFDLFQFILEIEETFGVTLSAEDTQSDQFRTIGGLIQIIEEKLEVNS